MPVARPDTVTLSPDYENYRVCGDAPFDLPEPDAHKRVACHGNGAHSMSRVSSYTAKYLMFFVVLVDCLRWMRRVLNLE